MSNVLRRALARVAGRGPTGPQGPAGPQGPSGTTMWAVVDFVGGANNWGLIAGSHATAAEARPTGCFEIDCVAVVTFDRDVTNCAYTTTMREPLGRSLVTTAFGRTHEATAGSLTPNQVEVEMWDTTDPTAVTFRWRRSH
jgi:hypothetical protein